MAVFYDALEFLAAILLTGLTIGGGLYAVGWLGERLGSEE